MKKKTHLLLFWLVNQGFVGITTIFISRAFGTSHLPSFFAYIIRPLFLALMVSLFFTRRLANVPSFLGLQGRFLRPWTFGMMLTIPSGLLILLLLGWKHLPFSFVPGDALVHLVFIFLGPGLFEEGLYRGVLFRRLLDDFPWWRAGLYSGGLFAFAHLGNLALGYSPGMVGQQILHCLLISLLFGYLVWKLQGNIWACVAFHTFNNFYAAAFITDRDLQQNLFASSLLGILGLFIAFAGAVLLLHRKKE